MRIVHISTRDSLAGAFRGAYTLHHALRQHGIDSQMLVARKYTQDPTVHLPTAALPARALHALRMVREIVALAPYPKRRAGIFSPATVSANLQPALQRLAPDVIHLHWTAHGFVRPEDLPKWQRPLVWTLRDMWLMTGGCHLTEGCERYLIGCGSCPQLASTSPNDISHRLWQRKQKVFGTVPIHFITLSTWLAELLRASPLSQGHPIHVIPNAIQADVFVPQDKAKARTQLGLPLDKKILLFGAVAVDDKNKGFQFLREAIQQLASQDNPMPLHLATFGHGELTDLQSLAVSMTHLGYIDQNSKLATLYSAADVMVVPSMVESFGKTAAEALSCGTPVVSFDVTGLRDIVDHQHCGYRATAFDSKDLAQGITWILADDTRYQELSHNARAKVIDNFSVSRVAELHKNVYEQASQAYREYLSSRKLGS